MFGGGILVSPLLALGGEETAIPMAAVVAGDAIAALLTTAVMTHRPRTAGDPAARPAATFLRLQESACSAGLFTTKSAVGDDSCSH